MKEMKNVIVYSKYLKRRDDLGVLGADRRKVLEYISKRKVDGFHWLVIVHGGGDTLTNLALAKVAIKFWIS
jgi:hypothetical protein